MSLSPLVEKRGILLLRWKTGGRVLTWSYEECGGSTKLPVSQTHCVILRNSLLPLLSLHPFKGRRMNWMCSEALPMLLFPETLVLGCCSFRSQFEDEIKPPWGLPAGGCLQKVWGHCWPSSSGPWAVCFPPYHTASAPSFEVTPRTPEPRS